MDTLWPTVERDRASRRREGPADRDRRSLAGGPRIGPGRGSRVTNRDLKRSDADYADAFRKAGLDLDATGPDEAGKWLASRTEPIEIAGYLDDWAFVRRQLGRPEADWHHLVAAARGGDPDPWRDALRAKFGSNDADAVAEFAPHGR